jgi:hypothetical protein
MAPHKQEQEPHTHAATGRAQPHDFVGLTTDGRGSYVLPFPIDRVFPLYGPVAEARWAPDWNPTWIYPDAKAAAASVPQKGWTFFTSLDDADNTRTWQVDEYDADRHRAVYHVFYPRRAVYRIEVTATPQDGGTRTDVHYALVGLSEEGNRFVERRVAHFDTEMAEWKAQIEYYLRFGRTRPQAGEHR